jgi:4-oxalocrotonate tautomerase
VLVPYVNIQITRGATREQKKELVARVTTTLVEVLGKKPEHTHIVIQEIADEDWGFAGLLTDEWRAKSRGWRRRVTSASLKLRGAAGSGGGSGPHRRTARRAWPPRRRGVADEPDREPREPKAETQSDGGRKRTALAITTARGAPPKRTGSASARRNLLALNLGEQAVAGGVQVGGGHVILLDHGSWPLVTLHLGQAASAMCGESEKETDGVVRGPRGAGVRACRAVPDQKGVAQ